ncbi:MAG TPA: ABC transporter permease [Victivallales bacterium]|nr:ABC transporter permease [Victivallales bacterium]
MSFSNSISKKKYNINQFILSWVKSLASIDIDTDEPPGIVKRLYSVWFRHFRVYTKNIFANGFPPFIEPLIFLVGIGLGLGSYIANVDNTPYLQYLAMGLPLSSAMFSAAFECSYGTFYRMEYSKTYEGMLTSPLTITDLFIGEIIWCGTKGAFYSTAVISVFIVCGTLPLTPSLILVPFVGTLVGLMFGGLSLVFVTFVKSMNSLNFYMSGVLMPLFMFSGIMFPVTNLPKSIQWIVEVFPLVHAVRLQLAICKSEFTYSLFIDLAYCVAFIIFFTWLATRKLKAKLMK